MLEQYYNFLSERLVEWVEKKEDVRNADKYFLMLDNDKEVENFYQALKGMNSDKKIVFKSNQYDYSTVGIDVDGVRLIFVAPVNNVTQDFLVTVRNRINENTGEWSNTSVIFLVYDALDSIISGSYDLSQKNAPFNNDRIKRDIKSLIKNKDNLKKSDQDVLEVYLEEIVDNTNSSLRDYEIIFSILSKKKVENDDFVKMGFFPDSSLPTFTSQQDRQDRLKENKNAFKEVENKHYHLDIKDQLESFVSNEKVINKLSNVTNWKETDFQQIFKALEEDKQKKNQKLEIDFDGIKVGDNTDYWIREAGNTATKRKKIYLLMSFETLKENSIVTIPFTDSIDRASLDSKNIYDPENPTSIKEEIDINFKKNLMQIDLKKLSPKKTYGGQIIYKHHKVNRLKFEINFMVVPFSLKEIEAVKPNFEIEILKSKKKFYLALSSEIIEYTFGQKSNQIIFNNEDEIKGFDIKDTQIILGEKWNDIDNSSGSIRLEPFYGNFYFPISLKDDTAKPIPLAPLSIERLRLGSEDELIFEENKIYSGTQINSIEFNYKRILNLELEMIENNILSGIYINNHLKSSGLNLDSEVESLYLELFSIFKDKDSTPSLAINDGETIQIMKRIVKKVNQLIGDLREGEVLPLEIRDLGKIGFIYRDDSIDMTPFHPLMLAYQIELHEQLSQSTLIPRENILSTLNPQYLLPYLMQGDKKFQATYSKMTPRWLSYKVFNSKPISELGSKIIRDRLIDYTSQYKFLFETNPDMALKVAAINIVDETSFFSSVIEYFIKRIENSKGDYSLINPIDIYFDRISNQMDSLFGRLYEIRTFEQLEEMISFRTKVDGQDVIDVLKEKINVYRIQSDTQDEYYHVTFYQFQQLNDINRYQIDKLPKNYSLNGLINTAQFEPIQNKMANGFGVDSFENNKSLSLINTARNVNALYAASVTSSDIFRNNDTLINYLHAFEYSTIQKNLNNSSWVTFLNLDVELSYFYRENDNELLVIHYSDQGLNSQYESITVTNDLLQYERLIKDTFGEITKSKKLDTKEIIKNFNVLNGQWLLRLITDKSRNKQNTNQLRERLSIISGYKIIWGILEHKNFIWVPISLEEILRISGMVGLSKREGLFSTYNLSKMGITSDDLLFIGIEQSYEGLLLHFLPVEVKVGINNNSVISKAMEQINSTSDVFEEFLSEKNADSFMRDYYLQFFITIMLTNLSKLTSSGIYDEVDNLREIRDKLVSGQFSFASNLKRYFGKGIVLSFSKNQLSRAGKLIHSENAYLIDVPESDAYNLVSQPLKEIVSQIQDGNFDFSEDILLKNKVDFNYSGHFEEEQEEVNPQENNDSNPKVDNYESSDNLEIKSNKRTIDVLDLRKSKDDKHLGDIDEADPPFWELTNDYDYDDDELDDIDESYNKPIGVIQKDDMDEDEYRSNSESEDVMYPDLDTDEILVAEEEGAYPINNEIMDKELEASENSESAESEVTANLSDIRILIGEAENSNHKVYWEYGNKELSNRHLMITGKSGQGKTYYIQTILAELSKSNISSLVLDYTNGFLINQLDKQLTNKFTDKINNRYIIQEKLPINPFKRQMIDLGGFEIEESIEDMIDRVVQIIDFVFDLGIQQRTLLSETIRNGYVYTEDNFTFTQLADELRYSDDRSKQNLFGRLSTLLSRDPFIYDNDFDWGNIFDNEGSINIFQFAGFQLEIQVVMLEFLLWDIYQYASRTGNESKPLPIVLDEIQNLNFNSSSPVVKLLREGRKFGLSGILATQSLTSIKGNDQEAIFNAAEQVHFLPPNNQIQYIAKMLSPRKDTREEIENALKNLSKGHALDYGPLMNVNGEIVLTHIPTSISSFEERFVD